MSAGAEALRQAIRREMPVMRARWKVRALSLFGSYARGMERPDSDVDILADFEGHADLFDLMGVSLFLEETLKRKVDVVSRNGLRSELRQAIESEAVLI